MQVGDLLKGIHNGELFLIKEEVEIKRHLNNGVYLETIQGFRLAPLRFLIKHSAYLSTKYPIDSNL